MKKLLIANWKMNPARESDAIKLVRAIASAPHSKNVQIIICAPFIYLGIISKKLKVKLGAQNAFWEQKGTYTGEISPAMLKNAGVEYVILGHSERRKWLHETDEMINKKLIASLGSGLKPVLCVGEPLNVAKKGKRFACAYVAKQLEASLRSARKNKFKLSNIVFTYEPPWAISRGKVGSGNADYPEDALDMIRFMRKLLSSRFGIRRATVIYGGSVTSKNISDFLKYKEIEGALIGGASLDAKDFKKIIQITSRSI